MNAILKGGLYTGTTGRGESQSAGGEQLTKHSKNPHQSTETIH